MTTEPHWVPRPNPAHPSPDSYDLVGGPMPATLQRSGAMSTWSWYLRVGGKTHDLGRSASFDDAERIVSEAANSLAREDGRRLP